MLKFLATSLIKYYYHDCYLFGGKIYSCGQVGSDPRVNVIVSLPITASPERQWESIGYTWHFLKNNVSAELYIGCDSITSNGNKIFVEGGHKLNPIIGGGGVAVYESDISTTFNTQDQ